MKTKKKDLKHDYKLYHAGYTAGKKAKVRDRTTTVYKTIVYKVPAKDQTEWERKIDLFTAIAVVCMIAFAFLVLVTIHLYTSSNTCSTQLAQTTTVAEQCSHTPVFTGITATITRCGNDTG